MYVLEPRELRGKNPILIVEIRIYRLQLLSRLRLRLGVKCKDINLCMYADSLL